MATLLYSRLAHKEATGNSAYFLEYKPHLTYSFKVACPSKEQVHEERVEVVLSSDQTFRRDVVQTFRQFFPHNVSSQPNFFCCKEKKALGFNWDWCCHLALCLQLILFHFLKIHVYVSANIFQPRFTFVGKERRLHSACSTLAVSKRV